MKALLAALSPASLGAGLVLVAVFPLLAGVLRRFFLSRAFHRLVEDIGRCDAHALHRGVWLSETDGKLGWRGTPARKQVRLLLSEPRPDDTPELAAKKRRLVRREKFLSGLDRALALPEKLPTTDIFLFAAVAFCVIFRLITG